MTIDAQQIARNERPIPRDEGQLRAMRNFYPIRGLKPRQNNFPGRPLWRAFETPTNPSWMAKGMVRPRQQKTHDEKDEEEHTGSSRAGRSATHRLRNADDKSPRNLDRSVDATKSLPARERAHRRLRNHVRPDAMDKPRSRGKKGERRVLLY